MAKKSKKLEPDASGYISTGIYRKYVGPKKKITLDEFREKTEHFCRFTDGLIQFRSQIGDVIRPHLTLVEAENPRGYPAGVAIHAIDLGDGSQAYTVSPDAEPGVMDGVELLSEIRRLLPAIERGDAEFSAKFGYLLGMVHHRMLMRGYEPKVLGWEQIQAGRTAGGVASRTLTPEQEKLAREVYATEIRPGVSRTAACNRTAARLMADHNIKVSGKTVSRLLDRDNA